MKKLFLYITLSIFIFSNSYGIESINSFIKIDGNIISAEDVSGITKFGKFIIIGSDEAVGSKNYIQLLKRKFDRYIVYKDILLLNGKELDIEGIAEDGENIYIIGSHSSKRKKVKKSKRYEKNRSNFFAKKVEEEIGRDWLYRIKIDPDGKSLSKDRISLRHILKNDNVLKAFTQIPSKENGIDIEGIAAKNGLLYIGFRGPVFRGNYVPVLKLKFDNPDIYEIVYVQLGGFGIRGLTKVSDGFLILAGPVGDRKSSYQIFHWNGFDMIPGKNRTGKKGMVSKMYEIEPPKGGKAEGIAVINEERSHYKIILVYDGVKIIGNIFQRLIIQKK